MDLGQVLAVFEDGQQEAKSLHPHKTSHNTLTNDYISPRTWPSSCTSFFDTLSSSLTANCGFFSHSPVDPGTRRFLADQHSSWNQCNNECWCLNNPTTLLNSLYHNTGAWVASGARCYVAPRLPHCAAPCRCVCACRVCSTGALQYTRPELAQQGMRYYKLQAR